jgi:hypothetical protein
MRKGMETPIPTYFVDSTPLSAPFMNSKKTSDGFDLTKGLTFLGRSGVKLINGLKVAYVSGVDFDALSTSAPPTDAYLGHYFTSSDLTKLHQDYLSLSSARSGVDLLLCCQPPLLLNPLTATTADHLSSASSSLAALVDLVKPRYLYSSTQDTHFKRPPIKYPSHYTRYVALGSLNGRHKPEGSKEVYIQAIEIEPLGTVKAEELVQVDGEWTDSPYGQWIKEGDSLEVRIKKMQEVRLEIGKALLSKQEEEERKRRRDVEESKRQHARDEDPNYKREERIVYVTGFDKGVGMPDLEQYLTKYGVIANLVRQTDEKGRGKNFVFVEYKTSEAAQLAVEDSGRANLMGRRLTINYKISRVKQVVDRDCWFCSDNPNIERHLIVMEKKNFYVALPKGPACDEHFLIIPHKHIGHSLELDPE